MNANIPATPREIQSNWRSKNVYPLPYSSRAVIADALKTITAPMKQRAAVAPNSFGSGSRLRGTVDTPGSFPVARLARLARERPDEFLENAPAMLVILELVEA